MSLNKSLKVAEEAVVKGGKKVLTAFKRKNIRKWYKTSGDAREVATETDVAVEKLMKKVILKSFPKHDILGEEQGDMGRLSRYRWILDPIDGTANFALDVPFFCCSAALEYDGKIIVGAVYDPVHKELFSAKKGGSARLNGKIIKVSRRKIEDSLVGVAAGFTDKDIRHFSAYLGPVNAACKRIRDTGSMTLEMCYVAAGRYDASVKVKQHYWDYAAAELIVQAAGGKCTDFSGEIMDETSKTALVSNGKNHAKLLRLIKKCLKGLR